MKRSITKSTRRQLQLLIRLICLTAAMLFFVISAHAQSEVMHYAYSEIYLSVDNGEWSEFARGSHGESTTIKLGSSYTFRMMVYEGKEGTPKIITALTLAPAKK
jgi:hypothetical protein